MGNINRLTLLRMGFIVGLFLFALPVSAQVDTFQSYTNGTLAGQNGWYFLSSGASTVDVTTTAECLPTWNNTCLFVNTNSTVTTVVRPIENGENSGFINFAFKATNQDEASNGTMILGMNSSSTGEYYFKIELLNAGSTDGIGIYASDGDYYNNWLVEDDVWYVGAFTWENGHWYIHLAEYANNAIQFNEGSLVSSIPTTTIPEYIYITATSGGANGLDVYVDNFGETIITVPEDLEDTIADTLEDLNFSTDTRWSELINNISGRFPFVYLFIVQNAISNLSSATTTPTVTLTLPTSTPIQGEFELFSQDTFTRYLGNSNITLIKGILTALLWLTFIYYIYRRAKTAF